jgi:pSer/pThr/pTyr-binding forkhead associated (FHA) protein
MTLGGVPPSAEAVLRDLRISRIHCEIEVDEGPVVVGNPGAEAGGTGSPRSHELQPGQVLQVGHSSLYLEAAVAATAAPALSLPDAEDLPGLRDDARPEESAAAAAAREPATVRRLFIVDGFDKGGAFVLPDTGTVTMGQSHKHADLVLHDLLVSRIHCELNLDGGTVVVKHVSGMNGTLINGQRITQQELRLGEILRVGNSQMRLEVVAVDEVTKPEKEEEDSGFEVLEDAELAEVVEDVEVVEEVEDAEVVEEAYALPHSPIDALLELEDQALGHFRIGKLLGRGHSGVVFRAVDDRTNQPVALKVLSPDFPKSDAELLRFVRALKIVSQLSHPHLVGIHTGGKSGGYCWISREYVEGESLARLIQRLRQGGRLDWTRACRVALHLARALDFLHGHRVTHGNLTPRNVLVRTEDRSAKLADLMLNQALDGSALQKAILGKKLLAELAYLPPEQTDPHDPVTPAADLYSLGGVLYALLTGQTPFPGDTPREVRARIRQGKVVPPSRLQKGIPVPFEAAVLKLLARRPEDRFESAQDLLADIEAIASEHGVDD